MAKAIIMGEGYVDTDCDLMNGKPSAIKLNADKRGELVRTYQKRMKLVKKRQPYRLLLVPINREVYERRLEKELDRK